MPGYTVIDTETTGLSPRQDRIVELAVVYVDDAGTVTGHWTTLLNPGRDVGPSRIHGISARDVIDAPRFDQVAPHLLRAVAGRTIVAHNARFDVGFLAAEFQRAGVPLSGLPLPSLCTMEWATHVLSAQSRRLQDCCAAAGVRLDNAHSALGDARATAHLLSYYIKRGAAHPQWRQTTSCCAGYAWPTYAGEPPRVQLVHRTAAAARRPDDWLDRLMSHMPRANDAAEDSYLEVLGRALVDRHLSAHEQTALVMVAEEMGLGRGQIDELHERYLNALAATALLDGLVTDDERHDLERVADCLGLGREAVTRSLTPLHTTRRPAPVAALNLLPGDRVVITGDTRRSRDDWEARLSAVGLTNGTVTKATRVVVAADPDSQSGKAQRAREYGVPIVTEAAFEAMFVDYCRRLRSNRDSILS